MWKNNKKKICIVILLLFISLILTSFFYTCNSKRTDTKIRISSLLQSTYENLINYNINFNNCELLHITPSFEWMIKEISLDSPDVSTDMIVDLIKSFTFEEKYPSADFKIIELKYFKLEEDDIDSLNKKTIDSVSISADLFHLESDNEFFYIDEAYSAKGIIQYSTPNNEIINLNFDGIIVVINNQHYILEYQTTIS